MMQNYRVQLDTYSGPLDLLLYLIRREEVDIYDIPISRVLDQYIHYVRVLEVMDPDGVGDFLVMAATLMEIKSRLLLPKPPPEVGDEDLLDPRADLVRQLLAYRAFRDAAGRLGERADEHSKRFGRPKLRLPNDGENDVDIEDVQIWDLLTAFNKLLASVGGRRGVHEVIYDDTPITLHAADIQDRLQREGPSMPFEKIFEGRNRSEMIGLFLALLELIRQDRIRIEQTEIFGPIFVHLIDATPITEVMQSADERGFKEYAQDEEETQEIEEAAFEEVEPEQKGLEPVFEDEEDELAEEDDEYRRRINAVEISDIDLGRSRDVQATDTDAPEGEPGS
ncbi:MAG: segregation/condensation protein A [Planctomycetes bacterium]|nr:segregation/condensation protein A [Planctomycetota bacterium]